jgi:hypothetical protein
MLHLQNNDSEPNLHIKGKRKKEKKSPASVEDSQYAKILVSAGVS